MMVLIGGGSGACCGTCTVPFSGALYLAHPKTDFEQAETCYPMNNLYGRLTIQHLLMHDKYSNTMPFCIRFLTHENFTENRRPVYYAACQI